jgi:outer membrane lipoprotein SlyB
MKSRLVTLSLSAATISLLFGCALEPRGRDSVADAPGMSNRDPQRAELGRVSSIETVAVQGRNSGTGAVLGAVLGAVVGSQIGGGSGRALATGVGVVGGAVAGNSIEKYNKADDQVYRVHVRMNSGEFRVFDFHRIDDLRTGDRVKVESGQLYRL